MTTSTIHSLLALIIKNLNTRHYYPVILWDRTNHNAPYTHRNYVVVNTGIYFRG